MPVYKGIEHLDKIATSASVYFDTETLQLQPERCKMRLLQLGSATRDTVVLIDCFELERKTGRSCVTFSTALCGTGWHITLSLIWAGCKLMTSIRQAMFSAPCCESADYKWPPERAPHARQFGERS